MGFTETQQEMDHCSQKLMKLLVEMAEEDSVEKETLCVYKDHTHMSLQELTELRRIGCRADKLSGLL